MERRINELERHLPKPQLYFQEESLRGTSLTCQIKIIQPLGEDEIAKLLAQKRTELLARFAKWVAEEEPRKQTKSEEKRLLALPNLNAIVFARGRYEENVESYMIEYQKYLTRLFRWSSGQALSTPIHFSIENSGSGSANGIVVQINLPDGLSAFLKENIRAEPELPNEPQRPSSLFDFPSLPSSLYLGHSFLNDMPKPGIQDLDNSDAEIVNDN